MPTIRVYDTETTGMDPATDRVVEIAFADVVKESVSGRIEVVPGFSTLVDPGRPIPAEASAIHHITDRMVREAPAFDEVWPHYAPTSDDIVAVAAHNWGFDSGFLPAIGRPAICTYKAALRVWPDAPSHSNQALRYWLGLDLQPAGYPHRALYDAEVTAHILVALLAKETPRQMAIWTAEPALQPVCKIGKHRGEPWDKVPLDFLQWVIGKGEDFDADTRWNVQREIDRRKAEAGS